MTISVYIFLFILLKSIVYAKDSIFAFPNIVMGGRDIITIRVTDNIFIIPYTDISVKYTANVNITVFNKNETIAPNSREDYLIFKDFHDLTEDSVRF